MTPQDADSRACGRRSFDQARSILAHWVDNFNTELPHSPLSHVTLAAFAPKLEKQRAGLIPPVASPGYMRANVTSPLFFILF